VAINRVAIIGAGIGAQHLQAYLALPDRYVVQMLCDIDTDRARALIDDRTDIELVSDIQVALSDPSIDLIDICLPPHLHFDVCMQALRHNKHVVCEKPLVNSLDDADSLISQAQASGKIVSPVFQYRYGLATAQLHALINAGYVGRPLVASIETHWNRQEDYYAVPWRGTWQGEQGGAVLGHAIHNHDLLCLFFGSVKSLSAMTATRVNDIETEDCASISFEMENGALASSSITLGASHDTTRLRFCFEGLTAESGKMPYAPAEDKWTFTARGGASQSVIDQCVASVKMSYGGYAGFFASLADALDGQGGREVTLQDGRRSIELVTAIYTAARSGSRVFLPLESGCIHYSGWCPEVKIG